MFIQGIRTIINTPYIGLNFAVYESLEGYGMTFYHAQACGHKLRVLTHERDLPVVVKLSCGAMAGSVAQTDEGRQWRIIQIQLNVARF